MTIRAKRVVVETCPRCGRAGWRHEIGFQLLSEDEFEKIMGHALDRVKGLPAGFEPMWAGCGSSIYSAIEDAKGYCHECNCKGVGFDFNGLPVFVTAESDVDKVYREWWQEMYHETPEESYARR